MAPTATQLDADEQETPLNCPTFPGRDTCDQVVPSSVLTMAAPAPPDVPPTATHREELGQAAPDNAPMSDGTSSSLQLDPSSAVVRTTPPPDVVVPTAVHATGDEHATERVYGTAGYEAVTCQPDGAAERELRWDDGAHGAGEDRRTAGTRGYAFQSTDAPSFGMDRPIRAPSPDAAHAPRRLSHRDCLTGTSVDRREEGRNNRRTEDRQSVRPWCTEYFTVQTPDGADHKRRQLEEQQEDNNYLYVVNALFFGASPEPKWRLAECPVLHRLQMEQKSLPGGS